MDETIGTAPDGAPKPAACDDQMVPGDGDFATEGLPDATKPPARKKRDNQSLRKAPQAPKRFKSSYICFFMAKRPEIKEKLGDKATVTEVSRHSAEMWKSLPPDQRAYWDDMAAKDKQRYMNEKATYAGPWRVPWKRAKKDPSAPKRNMSAFLYFSQTRRTMLKEKNPEMKNTEISRLLGKMWSDATDEEKSPYVEREKEEREKYKKSIAEWRETEGAKQRNEFASHPTGSWVYNNTAGMGYNNASIPGSPPAFPPAFGGYPGPAPPPHGSAAPPPPNFGKQPPPPNFGKQPVVLSPNGMPYTFMRFPFPPPPPNPSAPTTAQTEQTSPNDISQAGDPQSQKMQLGTGQNGSNMTSQGEGPSGINTHQGKT